MDTQERTLATPAVDALRAGVRCKTGQGQRLVILGSPRSGNTWLRHLLAGIYGARELAFHNPAEVHWERLPADCVLQIHWKRTPTFLSLLQQHRFRVVVLARHPLDVLLSILHFAMHDGSTERWLEGEGGTEAPIFAAMPCSAAFLRYATSHRAAALLSISRQWWDLPEACVVRYEQLVAQPLETLGRVVQELGTPPRLPLAEVVAGNTFLKLRSRSGTPQVPEGDHHYWQAKPGHWKALISAEAAFTITQAHAEILSALEYGCDPDFALDRSQADANWIEINRSELRERLWSYVPAFQKLEQAVKDNAQLKNQLTAEREARHFRIARVFKSAVKCLLGRTCRSRAG